MSVIEASKEIEVLEKILYIIYLIWFEKNKLKALISLNNKVNIIILAYIAKLKFKSYYINIKT